MLLPHPVYLKIILNSNFNFVALMSNPVYVVSVVSEYRSLSGLEVDIAMYSIFVCDTGLESNWCKSVGHYIRLFFIKFQRSPVRSNIVLVCRNTHKRTGIKWNCCPFSLVFLFSDPGDWRFLLQLDLAELNLHIRSKNKSRRSPHVRARTVPCCSKTI